MSIQEKIITNFSNCNLSECSISELKLIVNKINNKKYFTKKEYEIYGKKLNNASTYNITLDKPQVEFNKLDIIKLIKYYRPKTLGFCYFLVNVNIQKLVNEMGSDDVDLAHTKIYNTTSTDFLSWLLDGLHIHAHTKMTTEITGTSNPISFIKYIKTLSSSNFEIPQIEYTSGIFNIIDGRHRLGFYRYFNINGPVYTNEAGLKKIIELGGHVVKPNKFVEPKKNAEPAKIPDFIIELAKKQIQIDKYKISKTFIPIELKTYSELRFYKIALDRLK